MKANLSTMITTDKNTHTHTSLECVRHAVVRRNDGGDGYLALKMSHGVYAFIIL